MSLVECPECGRPVSDTAAACPDCAAPNEILRRGRRPEPVAAETAAAPAEPAAGSTGWARATRFTILGMAFLAIQMTLRGESDATNVLAAITFAAYLIVYSVLHHHRTHRAVGVLRQAIARPPTAA